MSGWPVWTGTGYQRAAQMTGGLSPERTQAALDLVARQAPGYGLERAAHLDADVYRLEMERIWRPAWLFAAHSAELPEPGARTTFDVGDGSVLVVRGDDGRARAFHNFCRHRGNRLAARGARQTVATPFIRCPYHDWVYGLDGSLIFCRGTDQSEGLDPAAHGLVPVASSEVGGMILVRLGPHPGCVREVADVSEVIEPMAAQGFEHTKVAHTETYMVNAGWKVIWEGNPEPWRRHTGHPEPHFGAANVASAPVGARVAGRAAVIAANLGALPNLWCHAGAGHVVTARLAPIGPERTEIVVTLLVDQGAVGGRGSDLDSLLPAWVTASEKHWAHCEQSQQAVRSAPYRPSFLSDRHRANVASFHAWYREAMAAGPRP